MSNADQVAIVDSIDKHLDALKVTIGWALLVAIVFIGAGLTADKHVRALGLTIDIDHAFFVAAAFYTFANLKVLALLIRLRHLMQLLADGELVNGLKKVALHPFIANPFGYFVSDAPLINSAGAGLLIVAWWAANSSLLVLSVRSALSGLVAQSENVILGAFLMVGLASLREIFKFDEYAMERLRPLDVELHQTLKAARKVGQLLTLSGILVGGGLAAVVRVLGLFLGG